MEKNIGKFINVSACANFIIVEKGENRIFRSKDGYRVPNILDQGLDFCEAYIKNVWRIAYLCVGKPRESAVDNDAKIWTLNTNISKFFINLEVAPDTNKG